MMRLSNNHQGTLETTRFITGPGGSTSHPGSCREVEYRERECGPGALPLLGSKVRCQGFHSSLFIGELETQQWR